MNKNKKFISIFIILLIVVLIVVILPLLNKENNVVQTFKNFDPIKIITNKSEAKVKDEDKNVRSKDIIGKISILGTNIDSDLMQTTDNEYYLNHSIDGKKNYKGSIFMDYRNTTYDRKLLIYGHNSETLKNVPFHDLEKYLSKSFYNLHKNINLTLNNEESTWEIFSVMIVEEGNNNHMKITFNDKEWIKHIDWMKKNSVYDTYVDVGVDDKIVTLQTCYYKPKNSYLIVNAKKSNF